MYMLCFCAGLARTKTQQHIHEVGPQVASYAGEKELLHNPTRSFWPLSFVETICYTHRKEHKRRFWAFEREVDRYMEVMHNDQKIDELNTVTPADWVSGPQQGDWTYETYAALTDDGECYEIVQGVLVMSPAPRLKHQKFVLALSAYLYEVVTLVQRGEVVTGPFDVVLSPQNVVQPDVFVVLSNHLERLQEECLMGAPDLAVEVISPSSRLYDRVNKHMLYELAGVPEYWLVDPHKQDIELFLLEGGKYYSQGHFSGEQALPSRVVPQMDVPVSRFFL